MSYNSVNQTTGELTRIAGLFKSDALNSIIAAFPNTASASNKLITEAEIGMVTDTQYSDIQTLLS